MSGVRLFFILLLSIFFQANAQQECAVLYLNVQPIENIWQRHLINNSVFYPSYVALGRSRELQMGAIRVSDFLREARLTFDEQNLKRDVEGRVRAALDSHLQNSGGHTQNLADRWPILVNEFLAGRGLDLKEAAVCERLSQEWREVATESNYVAMENYLGKAFSLAYEVDGWSYLTQEVFAHLMSHLVGSDAAQIYIPEIADLDVRDRVVAFQWATIMGSPRHLTDPRLYFRLLQTPSEY